MPSLVHDHSGPVPKAGGERYDLFISTASEKDSVVRDLANALTAEGLRVWFDEFTLSIGDSLQQKIDRGLASSRSG